MEKIDVVNIILKNMLINVFIFMTFAKLINYKYTYKNKVIIFIISIAESLLEFLLSYIPTIVRLVVMCVSYGYVNAKMTKNRFIYSTNLGFISLTITYLIYIISIVSTSVLLKVLNHNIQKNNVIILIISFFVEGIILHFLFKMKRFKNGIPFLKNEEKVNNIGIIGIIFIGMVLIIYSIMPNTTHTRYIFIGLAIEAICLFIWIKKKITKYYKQKLKEQTVADLQNEIKEKDSKINEILEENKAIATINHKYSSRIKALEEFTSKITSKPELLEKMKTEFGEDYTAFEEQIKKLSKEYSNEIKTKITKENNIPKTGIFGIDALLEHMSTEATNSNIHMDIKINASINYMVEKIISESALETLLGDHIKDAIIAINSCNNTNRRILVVISIVDKCYEISFYDTGIEFEINTLIKLGKEQITTHKETGGSGIGFMTTFETLSKTKGSLIIEEKHPMNNTDYSKAIKIKFDNKNEYRIKSYRAEEIKKQRADIIIEK